MRIEIYRREQKKWIYEAFEADDEVELTTLGVRFPVADAYEDVILKKKKTTAKFIELQHSPIDHAHKSL